MSQDRNIQLRKRMIVIINLLVAGLHLITGKKYQGPFPRFVNGYLIDILLPFCLYFLLCLVDYFNNQPWYFKALLVLLVAFLVETAQYLDYSILGSAYDPVDYIAYTFGVALAILCDQLLFTHLFSFWRECPPDDK